MCQDLMSKILLIFIFLSVSIANAATLNMPADYPTIQAAIDAAVDGDTVLVASGLYQESIEVDNKNVIIESIGGAAVTAIDARELEKVFSLVSSESTIRGFTIQNGFSNDSRAGGIQIFGGSPKIENNIFRNNLGGTGYAISLNFGSPIIKNNLFEDNSHCCVSSPGSVIDLSGGVILKLNQIYFEII